MHAARSPSATIGFGFKSKRIGFGSHHQQRNNNNNNILNRIVRAAFATTAAVSYSSVSSAAFLLSQSNRGPSSKAVRCFGIVAPSFAASTSPFATTTTNLRTKQRGFGMFSSVSDDSEQQKGDNSNDRPLEALCQATLQACQAVTPSVEALYRSIQPKTTKTKADDSVFTIADGLVQYLFAEILLGKGAVGEIVGEEDCVVNLTNKPYTVDDLVVPSEFEDTIDQAIAGVTKARDKFLVADDDDDAKNLKIGLYQSLTAFIDPIDGTREFSTQKGEQCTICVGFANTESGNPVAGVVYRPLSSPHPTWAVGAKAEDYAISSLLSTTTNNAETTSGLLTTNGSISPFLESFLNEASYERVPSGGAGNKMLMLLEGRGTAYIQDRGVSRWDTCAAQAILQAHGGILCKLDRFLEGECSSYTYRKTDQNLDFVTGLSRLTKYNAAPEKDVPFSNEECMAMTPSEVKPYANLCGLVALSNANNNEASQTEIRNALKRAASSSPPAFD